MKAIFGLFFAVASIASAAENPNVLLITVDTLRADHLSCYGYRLKTSPNIDRLASEGVRFERASTTIPLTGPAHFSLFTSRYPQEHGAIRNGLAPSDDSTLVALPQVLRQHGYRTAAFVSSWPLTSRLTHMDRWFDHYDEDLPRSYQWFNSMRDAEDVTPRAVEWLEQNGSERFFLWVHYFDPHSPYDLRQDFWKHTDYPEIRNSGMRERVRRYDSEIAYADHYIGVLLEKLDKLNLRDSTLVVLTADHGESLGEHSYVGHGRHLYDNIVQVPLMFRMPGLIPAGEVVDGEVSLLDITPTVLDLTVHGANGDSKPPLPFAGRSLANVVAGDEAPPARPIRYLTFAGKKGFFPNWLAWMWTSTDEKPLKIGRTDGDRKLVWTVRSKKLVAYDLRSDPLEKKPSTIKRGTAAHEREITALDRWFAATATGAGRNNMTEEDVKALKSLGYLQ